MAASVMPRYTHSARWRCGYSARNSGALQADEGGICMAGLPCEENPGRGRFFPPVRWAPLEQSGAVPVFPGPCIAEPQSRCGKVAIPRGQLVEPLPL